jgi:hypothetical protein
MEFQQTLYLDANYNQIVIFILSSTKWHILLLIYCNVVGGHDQAYWIDDPTGHVSYGLKVWWNSEEYWKWIPPCPGDRFVSIDHQILDTVIETS